MRYAARNLAYRLVSATRFGTTSPNALTASGTDGAFNGN